MQKTIRKYRLGSEPPSARYWLERPAEERLLALHLIRQEFHQWRYGAEPRLQRVCRIISLEDLVANKRALGRNQDLADLEQLINDSRSEPTKGE